MQRAERLLRAASASPGATGSPTSRAARRGSVAQIVALRPRHHGAAAAVAGARRPAGGLAARACRPDAPNQFVDQRAAATQVDADAARSSPAHGLQGRANCYPMVRGRLAAINGAPGVGRPTSPTTARRRLVEREFNLSWADAAAGRQPHRAPAAGGATATSGDAETCRSRRDYAETPRAQARRHACTWRHRRPRDRRPRSPACASVEWDSFRANFFVVFAAGRAGRRHPATLITSVHLPAREPRAAGATGAASSPNVTLIDIDALMTQGARRSWTSVAPRRSSTCSCSRCSPG
ncbi:MAG: hypothetical protein MZV65_37875 [Chromatiales bacterium]|nr:hypothetical protein [Chromatiales bacterium]